MGTPGPQASPQGALPTEHRHPGAPGQSPRGTARRAQAPRVCSERSLGGAFGSVWGHLLLARPPGAGAVFPRKPPLCPRQGPAARTIPRRLARSRPRARRQPGVCAVVLTTVCSPGCVTDSTAAVGGACGSRSPGAAVGSSSAARSHGGRGARRDTHSACPGRSPCTGPLQAWGSCARPGQHGPGPRAPRRGYPLTGAVRGGRRRARAHGAVTLPCCMGGGRAGRASAAVLGREGDAAGRGRGCDPQSSELEVGARETSRGRGARLRRQAGLLLTPSPQGSEDGHRGPTNRDAPVPAGEGPGASHQAAQPSGHHGGGTRGHGSRLGCLVLTPPVNH